MATLPPLPLNHPDVVMPRQDQSDSPPICVCSSRNSHRAAKDRPRMVFPNPPKSTPVHRFRAQLGRDPNPHYPIEWWNGVDVYLGAEQSPFGRDQQTGRANRRGRFPAIETDVGRFGFEVTNQSFIVWQQAQAQTRNITFCLTATSETLGQYLVHVAWQSEGIKETTTLINSKNHVNK